MPLKTPVLFIIFNRPELTREVFASIREARPERLYVAADGPRSGKNEEDICEHTRSIVDKVDWPCEVITRFKQENLGCGLGPKTAIDWFFEHEEQGIILEDDCKPSQSFYAYCEDILELYKDDKRIMHVGGSNFQYGYVPDPDYSYYFSYFSHEWGWASWRRAWKLYDFNLTTYPEIKRKGYLKGYFSSYFEKKYRLSKTDKTRSSKEVDWWDYQWDYAKFINSGLSIIPNYNLIENLGFGEDATHTKSHNDVRKKNTAKELEFPLKHPPFVIRNQKADKRYFKRFVAKVILLRKILGFLGFKGYSIEG
ncbi:MAG: nucleotide-diphospho-sugar transferase [Leeuwenhoekiella sp.]